MEHYSVVRQIGRGNFGSVYLVEERGSSASPPPQWVVKKIAIFGMQPQEAEHAMAEARMQKAMHHPCIVGYKDSWLEDEHLHIAMEYCNGGDLGSAIKRAKAEGRHFSEAQVLDWFSQLCFAVRYIHAEKILHRDLKTQNVFLTDQNLVRLGDFGIAKVLDNTLASAKSVVGTPYYMSPEVCQSKPYNANSDVWALGCVLYELCTLCHAFEADSMLHLVVKIVQVRGGQQERRARSSSSSSSSREHPFTPTPTHPSSSACAGDAPPHPLHLLCRAVCAGEWHAAQGPHAAHLCGRGAALAAAVQAL